MKKYSFRIYNKDFPKLYQKEKTKLKKILKKAKIEHIGSTAVPKLKGKGVIDIIISVPKKEIKKAREKLKKAGYLFKEKAGSRDRLFFEKDYKHNGKTRRVHLHLTSHNSLIWKRSVRVRDYLKENPKKAKEYERIKKRAVKIAKNQGKVYRKYKEKFLNKLSKKIT